MSVLARKRSKSKYEFYTNAIKLRSEVTKLLLRDLGVKDKVREVHEFTKDAKTGKVDRRRANNPQRISDTV